MIKEAAIVIKPGIAKPEPAEAPIALMQESMGWVPISLVNQKRAGVHHPEQEL